MFLNLQYITETHNESSDSEVPLMSTERFSIFQFCFV